MSCPTSAPSLAFLPKRVSRYAATVAARRGLGLELHGQILQMAIRDNSPLHRQAQRAARLLLRQLAPRDQAETMQVHQLLWTHALLAGLAAQAQHQDGATLKLVKAVRDLSESFRRQLADYQEQRHPARRSHGGFVAIRNANIAANFPPPPAPVPQLAGDAEQDQDQHREHRGTEFTEKRPLCLPCVSVNAVVNSCPPAPVGKDN